MRGKSSSSKSKNVGVEIDKHEKPKEPNLSGAYIRSLVKQLSSSRTKESSSNFKEHENLDGEGILNNQSSCQNPRGGFSNQKPEKSNQPPQQHKKQVRRRLHTSRPYQERLLNMAEARREIVTALKFHRAAMKQASDKQQQQQLEPRPEIQPTPHQLSLEEEAKLKSRRNPRIYASNSSFSNNNNYPNSSYLDNFSYSQGFCTPYPWPVPPITPPPLFQENLNFTLPSQTLGLNLNLQDFNCFDSTTFNPSSIYSSSSASTSSSPLSAATEEILFVGPPASVAAEVAEFGDPGLHHAMDDKEMAEIRSIGEQYQVEWNDTLNLVNSAWWFEFLKAIEISPEDKKGEDFLSYPFDEVVEFPAWLNANGSCLQHVDDYCTDNYCRDPVLPCMDIEEIDGMDGDWLA